jgi:hypothetical protein
VVQRKLDLGLKFFGNRQNLCELIVENLEVGALHDAQFAYFLNRPRVAFD